jgi:hypothetical protein
LKNK